MAEWETPSRARYDGTRANIQVVAGSKDFKRCWFIHRFKIFIQWKIKAHHKILFSLRVDFHLLRFVGARMGGFYVSEVAAQQTTQSTDTESVFKHSNGIIATYNFPHTFDILIMCGFPFSVVSFCWRWLFLFFLSLFHFHLLYSPFDFAWHCQDKGIYTCQTEWK